MPRLATLRARRWLSSLVGTLALALLVWYAGDLITIAGKVPLGPPSRRLVVAAGLLVAWVLAQVVVATRSRTRDRHLLGHLASPRPDDPDPARAASGEERAVLEKRFQDALRLLRSRATRRRLKGRLASQLPWYLIIGPPGSGKTTALINSGLSFPLAEDLGDGPVHGIGGTRDCDWWFTADAVLIDTAGRYTTQDSYEEVDRSGWLGFLALLKRYRPRLPINGVVVAISLADILQQSAAERSVQAHAIRSRLQELHETFQIRFPVYVFVMKTDLVAGFVEFFADLGQEGREQVWGVTWPVEEEGGASPIEDVRSHLTTLQTRLFERRLARMEAEQDAAKRALIFAFPQQFAALGSALAAFLQDLFAPASHHGQPLVRGLYFTSGTQTGTPIDRVLAQVAKNFGFIEPGQQPFSGTGRGYFLTRLFREVVFPESRLAGFDPRRERRRRRGRAGVFAVLVAGCAIAVAAWTTSYTRNKAYIDATAQAVAEIEAEAATLALPERDPAALLPLLDRARGIPGGYGDRDRARPLLSRLGLDQQEKLGPQAERAYRRLLRKTLLPVVMWHLEDQVRGASGDPERLYDAMRVYLMLDSPDHYDADILGYRVARDWELNLSHGSADEPQREALKDHLEALLRPRPAPLPFALDTALIATAREILTRTPLAERLYGQLKREGLGGGLSDFSIAAAAGDYAKLVFERRSGRSLNEGVPALYTFDGYHHGIDGKLQQLIAAAVQDSWIRGSERGLQPGAEPLDRLTSEIRGRYLRDYVEVWRELINDIEIKAPRDLRHAAEIARVLADRDQSPLRRLLMAAMAQTALDRRAEPDPGPLDSERQALSGFHERVDRRSDEVAGSSPRLGAAPETYVSRRFSWLPDLMEATQHRPAPFDRVQAALDRAHLLLNSMAAAASSGRGVLAASETAELEELTAIAEELPAPVSQALGRFAQDSIDIFSGDMRSQLNRLWTAEILPVCRDAIHDRYPFDGSARRDTALHDFAQLLGPEGLLDRFFTENLAPLVDISDETWRWAGEGVGIPDEVLASFERAAVIRRAFFAEDGRLPAVHFELVPLALDPQTQAFRLELGGQTIEYHWGSREAHRLRWPSPVASGRAAIEFVDMTGTRPGQTFSGAWAWFRLLEAAETLQTDRPERYRLAFSLGGHQAQIELRALGARNPLSLDALRGFRCPDRL